MLLLPLLPLLLLALVLLLLVQLNAGVVSECKGNVGQRKYGVNKRHPLEGLIKLEKAIKTINKGTKTKK